MERSDKQRVLVVDDDREIVAAIVRLLEREGTAGLARFQARWIPLEEADFQTFRLPERCDLVLDTGRS